MGESKPPARGGTEDTTPCDTKHSALSHDASSDDMSVQASAQREEKTTDHNDREGRQATDTRDNALRVGQ